MYTDQSSPSTTNTEWNQQFEPYYRNWINRSRGELPGIFVTNGSIRPFYVNENNRPANETSNTDSNYTWTPITNFINNVTALSSGRAALHWRFRFEGKGIFPNWMENAGYVVDQGDKPFLDFGNNAALNAMKNFFTAFAGALNNNDSLFSIGMSELSGSGSAATGNKVEFVLHVCDQCTKMMFMLFQNSGVKSNSQIRAKRQVMYSHADPKLFSHGSNTNYPNSNSNSEWITQNGIIRSGEHATVMGTEPNGLNIIDSNHCAPNPFGVCLPHASRQLPNADLDWFVLNWYFSAQPRGNNRDSNMGQSGADPAGIIPITNIAVVYDNGKAGNRTNGVSPQHVDQAMRTFGAAGTNALFWPVIGFNTGGGADPDPVIFTADDGTIANAETGFVITGDNFGDSKGTGWVRIYENADKSGDYATQTTTAWADGSITITGVQGSVDAGPAFLFVQNDDGDESGAFPITMQGASAGPVIQSISTTSVVSGASITLTGTDFGATQGTGGVELNTQADGLGTSVGQTETSWSDTQVVFTAVITGFDPGDTVYAILTTNGSDESNAVEVTVQPTELPVITDAEDELFFDGEISVTIDGANFGAQQGSGSVVLSNVPEAGGQQTVQTIQTWTDSLIVIIVHLGGLSEGELFLKVLTDDGQQSAGYSVQVLATLPEPEITEVAPDTVHDGLSNVVITGRYFGDIQGSGYALMNMNDSNTGLSGVCTISSWSDTQIIANIQQGNVTPGTRYMFVRNAEGRVNEVGYAVTLTGSAEIPVITGAGTGIFYDGQEGVVITGSNFEASQGTGKVYLNTSPTTSGATEQTVTSWGDTSITVDISHTGSGNAYLFVENDSGGTSAPLAVVLQSNPAPDVIHTDSAAYSDDAGFSDWSPPSSTTLDTSDETNANDTLTITDNVVLGLASGEDRLAVVAVARKGGSSSNVTITAITLDGEDGTEVDTEFYNPDGTRQSVSLYYWLDADLPATTGTYTLSVTFSASTNNDISLMHGVWPGIKQQAPEVSMTHELDNVTSISQNITTVTNGALLVDLGYHRTAGALTESAGSRELETTTTGISASMGAEFIATAGSQARGWNSNQSAETMLLIAAAWEVSGAGGTNDAYNGKAREAAGDNTGDEATFSFTGIPAATEIKIQEWHPTGTFATNTPFTYSGIKSGSGTINQNTNGGQWNTIATLTGTPISAGSLTVVVDDDANAGIVTSAMRLVVTSDVTNVNMTIPDTITINEENADVGVGTLVGGVHSATLIIDGTTVTEKINNLDTATIADSPGNFIIPLTQSFGTIQTITLEFVSTTGGWDWTVETKDASGPRLRLWRFAGGGWIPSDATVNITVTGIGAEEGTN